MIAEGASRDSSTPPVGQGERSVSGVPVPLDVMYEHAGIPAPVFTAVEPGDIPAPYRSLLDHERAMTMTLEAHHDSRVQLRTLACLREGHWYFRKVLLSEEVSGRPAEMGIVPVDLDAFGPGVRKRILRGRVPLGRLLRESGVDYVSRPTAFLAITPNPELLGVFWMAKSRTLYGRQTELTLEGRKVGRIVEILPNV